MSDSWSWLDPNNWNLDPSTWNFGGGMSDPSQMFIGTTQSQPTTMPPSPSGSGAAEGASTPSLSPSQQAQQDQSQQQQDQWDTSGTNKTKTPSFGEWLFSKEGAASLQKGAESLKSPESTAAPKGSTISTAQMGSGSQVVPGNSSSLMSLLQMLSGRRYLPMGYSGSSGSSTRGLLGY